MYARLSLLAALSLASCSDDGHESGGSSTGAGSETGSGSSTTASTVGLTSTDGISAGVVDGSSSSGSSSSGSSSSGTGGSSSSGEPGSTSSSATESTGDESTGTTGEVMECEPTNPGGDLVCDDDTVVAGELCYQTTPPLHGAGTFATRVWAGDLDDDSDPDALVLVEYPAEMAAALNDGLGNLTVEDSYDLAGGANTGSRDVAVADMDGDTWVDAVVAFASPASLRVLTNDGGGAFGFPIVTMLPQAPNAVALGDLDGDLHVDAVVADAVGITVHHGLGNGSFGVAVAFVDPGLVQARDLAVHDLDDDGDLDVAVAFAQTVAVFLNEGGMLGEPTTMVVPSSQPDDIAVGDVTGDDVDDIVVADGYESDIDVVVGAGDGSFALGPLPSLTGRFAVIGDADADCHDDVFSRTAPLMFDELTVYASDGLGGFVVPQSFMLHSGMVDMDGADFDGDTLTDVLFAIGPTGQVGVSLTEP